MWQTLVVLIIVAVALAILVRRLYRTLKGKEELCSCGTRSCGGKVPGGPPICGGANGKKGTSFPLTQKDD